MQGAAWMGSVGSPIHHRTMHRYVRHCSSCPCPVFSCPKAQAGMLAYHMCSLAPCIAIPSLLLPQATRLTSRTSLDLISRSRGVSVVNEGEWLT